MQEQDIFINALSYADPAERSRYLDVVCQADASLRQLID